MTKVEIHSRTSAHIRFIFWVGESQTLEASTHPLQAFTVVGFTSKHLSHVTVPSVYWEVSK